MVKTYDPRRVIITIGGVPMMGFADGTFIAIERDQDAFSKVTGADGETARSKSNNRAGSIALTLMQTSISNDVLESFAARDELAGAGIVPILVKDLNGGSVFFSATGWVRKRPGAEYSKEIGNRQWVFDCADMRDEVRGTLIPNI